MNGDITSRKVYTKPYSRWKKFKMNISYFFKLIIWIVLYIQSKMCALKFYERNYFLINFKFLIVKKYQIHIETGDVSILEFNEIVEKLSDNLYCWSLCNENNSLKFVTF